MAFLQQAADVVNHKCLAAAAAAKDEKMIGDAGAEVSQTRVDDGLCLLPHQGFVGHVVEIKHPRIANVVVIFPDGVIPLLEVFGDSHGRDASTTLHV